MDTTQQVGKFVVLRRYRRGVARYDRNQGRFHCLRFVVLHSLSSVHLFFVPAGLRIMK